MLSIRLQRVGRKGLPVYRIIVQDSHRHPTSGKIAAQIGTYDPHSKAVTLDKEKAQTFLNNGAQPTPRVVSLFQAEGIKLPKWVEIPEKNKQKKIKNAEKLRRNQPKEEVPAEPETAEEKPAEEAPAEAESAEAVTEATPEQEAAEQPKEDSSTEQIAEKEVADGQETVEDETAEPAPAADDEKPTED